LDLYDLAGEISSHLHQFFNNFVVKFCLSSPGAALIIDFILIDSKVMKLVTAGEEKTKIN